MDTVGSVNGRRLGILSLRADAVYCLIAGVAVCVLAGPLGSAAGVPASALVVASAATIVWAIGLWVGSRPQWVRPALRTVMFANLGAATAAALLSLTMPSLAISLLLGAVAVEIAAFAVSQGVALRRLA